MLVNHADEKGLCRNIFIALQNSCAIAGSMKKVEYRSIVSTNVVTVLSAADIDFASSFIDFISRLGRNPAPSTRSFAIEMSERLVNECTSTFSQEITSVIVPTCMSLLLQRCNDKIVAVRSRSISGFANALEVCSSMNESHAIFTSMQISFLFLI